MRHLLILLIALPMLSSCIRTRSDLEEKQQAEQVENQLQSLQKLKADSDNRLVSLEDQVRELTGRLEVAERQLGQMDQGQAENLKGVQEKMTILEEAVTKLDVQVRELQQVLQKIAAAKKAEAASRARSAAKARSVPKGNYSAGEHYFKAKEWRNAILNYQKYREMNPKGKRYADATYKIGMSFQELKLKDDAKAFYQEVIQMFPKSSEAKKAEVRLKKL